MRSEEVESHKEDPIEDQLGEDEEEPITIEMDPSKEKKQGVEFDAKAPVKNQANSSDGEAGTRKEEPIEDSTKTKNASM